MVDITQTRTTALEFLALPETTQPMQLIEGEIIVSPAPTLFHQMLAGLFFTHLNLRIPDGIVFMAPVDLHLDDGNVTQPDVVWVAAEGRCRLLFKYMEGAPDLIIEILSPGTATLDRTRKFDLYERHGVSEYWLVDPETRRIEVFTLTEGKYTTYHRFTQDETLVSPRLGASLDLKLIWKDVPGVTTPPE